MTLEVHQISQHLNPERFEAKKIQFSGHYILYTGERNVDNNYKADPLTGVLGQSKAIVVFKANKYTDNVEDNEIKIEIDDSGQEMPWFVVDTHNL